MGGWKQTPLYAIMAQEHKQKGLCLHTFSPHGNLAAIDGFDFPVRAIGSVAPRIYSLKSKLLRLLKR